MARHLYSPSKEAQILYLNVHLHEQIIFRILIYGSTLFYYISARQKKQFLYSAY